MKPDNRKIAIYSRKSKFTGKGESIENQITFCKDYLAAHFPGTDESDILIFEDEGFSGATTKRPQLQRLLEEVRNNNIKMVICYKLDRISRNVGDFANLKQELDNYAVDFISTYEQFDTTTSMGKAMLIITSVFAQLERDTIAERIRDNMRELAKSGRWLGGITPTGYKSEQIVGSVTVDGKTRKAYKLDIVPEEAETVKLIYSEFLQTNSLTGTETYLLQNHIQTKNGKNYTRFSIKAILENPVYLTADEAAWDYFNNLNVEIFSDKKNFNGKCGIMSYNKTLQKPGKANQKNDYSEWIVAVGKHKPLISSKDWIQVQKQLAQNSSKAYRKPKSSVALLSGILRCADCGSFMRPKLTRRFNADGEAMYSYLCEMKEKSRMQNCAMKNPNGNELDKLICENIKNLAENREAFISDLKNASKEIALNSDDINSQIEKQKSIFAKNEEEIKKLVKGMATAVETPAYNYITAEINNLHSENEKIKTRISELESILKNKNMNETDFDILEIKLSDFANNFDTLTVEEKRNVFRMLIKTIEWDGENANVYLLGDNTEPQCENSK